MKKVLLLLLLASSGFLSASAQDAGVKVSLRGSAAFDCPVNESYYSLDILLGYQLKDFLYFGIGTGLNNSFTEMSWMSDGPYGPDYGRETDRLLPLFARVKYNITRSRIAPFVAVDAGYLFAATGKASKADQGFFGVPAIGVDFFVGKGLKHYISVQIGILIQEHDYRIISEPVMIPTRSETIYGSYAPKTIRPDLKVTLTF